MKIHYQAYVTATVKIFSRKRENLCIVLSLLDSAKSCAVIERAGCPRTRIGNEISIQQ